MHRECRGWYGWHSIEHAELEQLQYGMGLGLDGCKVWRCGKGVGNVEGVTMHDAIDEVSGGMQ